MIETKLIIHWNVKTSDYEIRATIETLRAILNKEVERNNLGFKISELKVV